MGKQGFSLMRADGSKVPYVILGAFTLFYVCYVQAKKILGFPHHVHCHLRRGIFTFHVQVEAKMYSNGEEKNMNNYYIIRK